MYGGKVTTRSQKKQAPMPWLDMVMMVKQKEGLTFGEALKRASQLRKKAYPELYVNQRVRKKKPCKHPRIRNPATGRCKLMTSRNRGFNANHLKKAIDAKKRYGDPANIPAWKRRMYEAAVMGSDSESDSD